MSLRGALFSGILPGTLDCLALIINCLASGTPKKSEKTTVKAHMDGTDFTDRTDKSYLKA